MIRLLFLFAIFALSYNVKARDVIYNINYDLSAVPQQWSGYETFTRYPYDRYRLITCNTTYYTPNGDCPTGGEIGPSIP